MFKALAKVNNKVVNSSQCQIDNSDNVENFILEIGTRYYVGDDGPCKFQLQYIQCSLLHK